MKKIISSLLAVVMCLSLSACNSDSNADTTATEEIVTTAALLDSDIRTLKWGMLVDEVTQYELEKDYTETVMEFPAGGSLRQLTYQNVEFEGYNTEMILGIMENDTTVDDGLYSVSYLIKNVDFEEICNNAVAKYGEGEILDSTYWYWESLEKYSLAIIEEVEENSTIVRLNFFRPTNDEEAVTTQELGDDTYKCKFKYSDGRICGDYSADGNLCEYHFNQLNEIYNEYAN